MPLAIWRSGTIAGVPVKLSPALASLYDEVLEAHPSRTVTNADGSIGDARHLLQGNTSDHNARLASDGNWYINAIDIGDAPLEGFSASLFFTWLVQRMMSGKEKRLQYVVFDYDHNGKDNIYNLTIQPTKIRDQGTSDHGGHIHISGVFDPDLMNDTSPWGYAPGSLVVPQEDEDMPKYVKGDAPGRPAEEGLLSNGWATFQLDGGKLVWVSGEIDDLYEVQAKAAGASDADAKAARPSQQATVVPSALLDAALRRAGIQS